MSFIKNETCPGCGAKEINPVNTFSVRQDGKGVLPDEYMLWSCAVCSLWFKDRRADSETLRRYYDELRLEHDQWNYAERLPHEKKIDSIISQLPPGANVLDVGCWTGRLLATHNCVNRYGIEPNRKAAAAADAKGVKIIGDVVSDDTAGDMLFDLITLVDVFEHLDKPVDILETLIRKLAPDGRLIIVTGKTNCFPVSLTQSTYWYFSVIPDHIVFLNAGFVVWAEKFFAVKSIAAIAMRHYPFIFKKFLWELSWLVTWRFFNPNSPFRKGLLTKIFPSKRFRNWVDIPVCTSFKDHYFITILK